jgi:hypothetical protein
LFPERRRKRERERTTRIKDRGWLGGFQLCPHWEIEKGVFMEKSVFLLQKKCPLFSLLFSFAPSVTNSRQSWRAGSSHRGSYRRDRLVISIMLRTLWIRDGESVN